MATQTKYLGSKMQWMDSTWPQVKTRIDDAWKAFRNYSKYWYTRVPTKHKINVFVAGADSLQGIALRTVFAEEIMNICSPGYIEP